MLELLHFSLGDVTHSENERQKAYQNGYSKYPICLTLYVETVIQYHVTSMGINYAISIQVDNYPCVMPAWSLFF
jgi:hypothetical protein